MIILSLMLNLITEKLKRKLPHYIKLKHILYTFWKFLNGNLQVIAW